MNARPGGYVRPVLSRVSSDYADHRRRVPPSVEPGTDYACAYGSSIKVAEDGVVVEVKTTLAGAMGRAVGIHLNDGRLVRYIHLSRISVKVGQRVTRGQTVAMSGASAWGREWGVGAHVHVSLWPFPPMTWPDKTINFEPQIGADNDGGLVFDQVTADRQNFLNAARGERLVVDGLPGEKTGDAIGRYQTFLKSRGWYSGPIDEKWGSGTQAGHERYFAEWSRPASKPAPTGRAARVADLAKLSSVEGLQKIARLYGYEGRIDNVWGGGSQGGLQRFLDQNYGGSLAAWLRSKWGYRDRDDLWGPNMAAAAARANAANLRAL